MAFIDPARLSTEDLVKERTRTRLWIKIKENTPAHLRTNEEKESLTEMRAYLRRLMRECGTRFIQTKLF